MLVIAVRESTAFLGSKLSVPCVDYCSKTGCDWTKQYSCPWAPPGTHGRAGDDGSVGYECCCVQRTNETQPCGGPPAPPAPPAPTIAECYTTTEDMKQRLSPCAALQFVTRAGAAINASAGWQLIVDDMPSGARQTMSGFGAAWTIA